MFQKKPYRENMDLWEHLEDLRWALIKSAIALLLCTVASFAVVQPMLTLLMQPALHRGAQIEMIFSTPMDGFMTQFKAALLGGAVLASPLILYFLASFVAPALTAAERRVARGAVVGGVFLFICGLALGYVTLFIMIPALMFFNIEGVKNLWSLKSYMDFCIRFMLGTGVVFEMPMVLMVLGRFGLVKAETLSRIRPYATIGIFIVAAIVTPSPDIFSQVMVGLPMVFLYEFSILLVRWQQRRRAELVAVEE